MTPKHKKIERKVKEWANHATDLDKDLPSMTTQSHPRALFVYISHCPRGEWHVREMSILLWWSKLIPTHWCKTMITITELYFRSSQYLLHRSILTALTIKSVKKYNYMFQLLNDDRILNTKNDLQGWRYFPILNNLCIISACISYLKISRPFVLFS